MELSSHDRQRTVNTRLLGERLAGWVFGRLAGREHLVTKLRFHDQMEDETGLAGLGEHLAPFLLLFTMNLQKRLQFNYLNDDLKHLLQIHRK